MTATPAGMTYADYLQLDTLLDAQRPLSDLHDEMLFIVIHQTKELWLKQMLHEVGLAIALVRDDKFARGLQGAVAGQPDPERDDHVVGRARDADPGRLQRLPPRARHQQRLSVGPVPRARIPARHQGPQIPRLSAKAGARASPARGRARRTVALGRGQCRARARRVRRTATTTRSPPPGSTVYRHADEHFGLYQLAEKLVDIDDSLAAWRHKHVLTVERIIGRKRGTGGSAGVDYLLSTISKRAFPQLWSLRTEL